MKNDARFHAFKILKKYYNQSDRLHQVRDIYFKHNSLTQQDLSRALVLTNEVVRWESRLDGWITSNLDKPITKLHPSILIILRLGYFEALMDDAIPPHAVVHSWVELTKKVMSKKFSGLVNAVMRKTIDLDPSAQPKNVPLSDWLSYPQWLVDHWINHYGEENTAALCHYFNKNASTDVRLNSWKNSQDDVASALDELEIPWEFSPESKVFIRISKGLNKILKSEWFQTGMFNIQNRSSGAVVELLDPQPNETILDVCAAPGTKTNYIVEKQKGEGTVIASDMSMARIKKGKMRSEALGYPVEWVCKDASTDAFPMADRILIDAPCTGTGVMGRRPDIRWRREKEDVHAMAAIQLAILMHMSQFLKKDGVMVYATCSLEAEENWNVVESFLKLNDNFFLESGKDFVPESWLNEQNCLATFPPRHNVDGMFAARLRNND